jgi:hypothetical protein
MEKRRGTCRVLVGKTKGNRPFGKPVSSRGDIEWDSIEWIDLAEDRDKWQAV